LKGFAPQLITDGAGLDRVGKFIERLRVAPLMPWDKVPAIGHDTETNVVVDFYWRRIRSVQIGNHEEQFLIDLLSFADGDEQKLIGAQGLDGRNSSIFDPIKKVLSPALCSNAFLKVGVNLPFEYEVTRWNLGMRIWNLYSADLVERVIKAGSVSLKNYPYFSMAQMVGRYFGKLVDKSLQKQFDLKTPLTQDQVDYGCLDVYLPLALRQQQLKITTKDQLTATAQIENDALGSYTDMHINGQRMNGTRWMARVTKRKAQLVEVINTLDTHFIPIVGKKSEAIDETQLNLLENKWRDLDFATEEEKTAAATYKAVSAKKEPVLRAQLKAQYELLERNRKDLKAAARVTFMELSKKRTKAKQLIAKCAGEALINYNSGKQLLACFAKMRGYTTIDATDKDTLLQYNDKPLIKALISLSALKKEIGTYGEQWTKQWTTKPCKEEGWLNPGDGRLHCVFNQLEAETGRSSSSKPNGQNLPQDDEIRACFCCDDPDESVRVSVCCDADTTFTVCEDCHPDHECGSHICSVCREECETKAEEQCIVTVDMSGAELRIIAELANAQSWITAFTKGQDVHSVGTEILYPELWPSLTQRSVMFPDGWTMAHVKSKTELFELRDGDGELVLDDKGKVQLIPPCAYYARLENGEFAREKCKCYGHVKLRNGNKATNFLLAYGGGPNALAEALGITVDEAKKLMKLHESKFPDIWGYLKRSGEQARFKKEARDMFGRRRLFPEPTWDGAREFFIQEHDDRLELDEEDAEANLFAFKKRELREPTEEEEYRLTHRDPSTKEISSMFKGMFASIERRGKNHCIQGSNASIIKRAMSCGFDKYGRGYLWHLLPQFRAKLLSMVHDELIVQCPKRYGQKVLECVGDAFARAAAEVMSKVKMEYDGHISDRWMK
jgi:DNA polymerase I-like protein with 3'-5' exonuclease and polymerase domains